MHLRALHLTNVRKFAGQRASITGIGDGISVVSQANEFGKSTFFDAIHALFFEKYSATGKGVKSLQPYAGGAVEVAAEVETSQGHFRIEKRFLSRKGARVLRLPGEAVIAQDDEAERWIASLLGSDRNGPAGLLWVRQGLTALDEARGDKDDLTQTRRDLLSSVSGEIDAMTGGRRMDRIMKHVAEDLAEITTKTGRRTGAWKTLGNEIAEMEASLGVLDDQIVQLGSALAARRADEAALAALDQAEAKAARDAALATAQEAFSAAKAHAGRVDMAAQATALAEIQAQAARGRLDGFLTAVETLKTAEVEAESAEAASAVCTEQVAAAKVALGAAKAVASTAESAVNAARKAQDDARAQAAARTARGRAEDLNKRLQKIDEAQKTRDEAQAKMAASAATPAWLNRVENAHGQVRDYAARRAAQGASLTLRYTGDTRAMQAGKELPGDTSVALDGATQIELPGIGTMALKVPEITVGDDGAQAALNSLLAEVGAADVAQARSEAVTRAEAAQARDTAQSILQALAPDGTDALRAAHATAVLQGQAAHDDPLPAPEALAEALTRAQTDETTARATLMQAEAAHASAREAEIRAQARAQTAGRALERAQAAAGPAETREDTRARLVREDAQATEAVVEAREALDDLTTLAPDLDTARAELTRAKQAVEAATTQRQRLTVRIAEFSTKISTYAEAGIEEKREALAGELDVARATEARFAARAAALIRLQTALEAERTAARDTYFGPVQAELKPLLAILYDDAGLQFDSDSLLPAGLTRAQTEESLDNLSGGTQEQIAILTRLAFARLFKGQGRHMPIVLDDALVYSDDARIVKMFTALNRVASDQQILVFSCRTMAFLELGGERPEVRVDDV